jgi:hypothetical protein
MYVCVSPKMSILLLTIAQEVEEIALSSGSMKLEGFIGLKGSRTKASAFLFFDARLELRL